jgi:hypothetical protein
MHEHKASRKYPLDPIYESGTDLATPIEITRVAG